ncbi:FecR family protein [Terrimonas pollutisoli]|uniref:FecR family protein n=1 Tax=Terrimonas pollutisoli TaxID=3034147 RepID=UPI0023ED078C|nr:FecR family protein [Terrimonas sp. H1YJ31]
MSEDLPIEELIIDDSFANYCFQSNEKDILFWQEYIRTHPSEKERIAEAMQVVLGLRTMLQQEKNNETQASALKAIPRTTNKPVIQKIIRYAAAVAAVFILVFGIKSWRGQNSLTHNTKDITATTIADNELVFTTAKGEKKTFLLPDSTNISLGFNSTLRMKEGFGKDNRDVYLSGEALFDVTHNKELPFVVHSNKYDVKVLGTVFNVKAYPEDKLSETSLIRGKVEISLANNSKKIILKPNQKAVISNKGEDLVLESKKQVVEPAGEKIIILPLSYNSTDSVVVETAWAQNRIEIVNENFDEIKNKLERWYNVKIIFADEEVSRYTFTATFSGETIGQVLKALQYSYHFTYKIEGKIITISK